MHDVLIMAIGFTLLQVAAFTFAEWQKPGAIPMIYAQLAEIGMLIKTLSLIGIFVGSISIVVWSFYRLSWYQPIVAYVIIGFVFEQLYKRYLYFRAAITTALSPPLTAGGLITLLWFTWFATP